MLSLQLQTRGFWQSTLVALSLFSIAFKNCHAVIGDGKKAPASLLSSDDQETTGSSNSKMKAKSLLVADKGDASKPDKATTLLITLEGNLKSTKTGSLIPPPSKEKHLPDKAKSLWITEEGNLKPTKVESPIPSPSKEKHFPTRANSLLLKTTMYDDVNGSTGSENSKKKSAGGSIVVKSLLLVDNDGSDTKKRRTPVKSLVEKEKKEMGEKEKGEEAQPAVEEEYLLVKKDLNKKSKSDKP